MLKTYCIVALAELFTPFQHPPAQDFNANIPHEFDQYGERNSVMSRGTSLVKFSKCPESSSTRPSSLIFYDRSTLFGPKTFTYTVLLSYLAQTLQVSIEFTFHR